MNYDRRAFAETYLLAQASDDDVNCGYVRGVPAYNAALREQRKRVLAGLEQLFGLTLDMASFRSRAGDASLFMLFRSTVLACLSPTTPGSGFLVASLLHRKLAEAGDAGARVNATLERIRQLSKTWQDAHLDVLEDLLEILLGERAGLVFTSADLKAAGVDDTRPSPADYPVDLDDF